MWTAPQSHIIHICLNFMLGLWNHNKPPKKGWRGTHPWCRSTSASPPSWPQSLPTVVSCLRPTWFPSATTFSCWGLLPLYSSRKWITSKRVCSDVWLLDVFHTRTQSICLWTNDSRERSECFELVVQSHLAAQPAWQENSAPGLWASPRRYMNILMHCFLARTMTRLFLVSYKNSRLSRLKKLGGERLLQMMSVWRRFSRSGMTNNSPTFVSFCRRFVIMALVFFWHKFWQLIMHSNSVVCLK